MDRSESDFDFGLWDLVLDLVLDFLCLIFFCFLLILFVEFW